jgi:hypothetical protein
VLTPSLEGEHQGAEGEAPEGPHGQSIEIDESKRTVIQNLRYSLLESDTEASTGLKAMHHTVVTRTLDRIQAKLPIDLQSLIWYKTLSMRAFRVMSCT